MQVIPKKVLFGAIMGKYATSDPRLEIEHTAGEKYIDMQCYWMDTGHSNGKITFPAKWAGELATWLIEIQETITKDDTK